MKIKYMNKLDKNHLKIEVMLVYFIKNNQIIENQIYEP